MTPQRLKDAFSYFRTVEVESILKHDYSDKTKYLNTSEKTKVITEFEFFVYDVISRNQELKSENIRLTNDINAQISYIRSLENQLSEAIQRISELNK